MQETLNNIPAEERQTAIELAKPRAQPGYEQVKQRDELPTLRGAEYVRRAAASLLNNEPVVIYPQGLFAPNVADRPGTGGYALIAREYERITGQPLPIVPVQVRQGKVTIRPPFTLPTYDRRTAQSPSEFYGQVAMRRIKGEE